MLPEFRVPIVLGGETHHLLVQDVLACVFWQGYPDPSSEATARDQRRALVRWLRHLLVRVTVKPALDLAWVRSWGDDYERPVEHYLRSVGFTPDPVVRAVQPGKLLQIETDATVERQSMAELAAFRGCVPPPHVQALCRLVARAVGLPASQLWLMPCSEFFFNYHVHLGDEEKAGTPLPEVKR